MQVAILYGLLGKFCVMFCKLFMENLTYVIQNKIDTGIWIWFWHALTIEAIQYLLEELVTWPFCRLDSINSKKASHFLAIMQKHKSFFVIHSFQFPPPEQSKWTENKLEVFVKPNNLIKIRSLSLSINNLSLYPWLMLHRELHREST